MFFFFKQKTAYEMRISDWSSDVCSSDLRTFAQECSDASRSPRNRRTADAARRIAECRNPSPPRARRACMKVVDNVARAFAPAGVGNIGVGFDLLGHSIDGPRDVARVRRVAAPGVRITAIGGDAPGADAKIGRAHV